MLLMGDRIPRNWVRRHTLTRMTPDEPFPDQVGHETGGCLKVPFTDEDGKQSWIRFILADERLHQETAASLGQPVLIDEEYAAMIKDITF
jgi:hypothetical protein